MLVERDEFYDVYRAIQADGAESPVTVLVSAADCDACAAFRTLRALFKADNVPFSAYPVAGYEDVQRRGAELPSDDKPRMVVLINCGGTENLRRLLGLEEGNGTRVAVIDAHRPLDLDNVDAANASVLVLRDAREQVPTADGTGAEAFPEAESGSDGEEEEHDSDRENADAGGRRVRQRTEGVSRAEQYYARGSFYGRPAACVLYDVAHAALRDGLEHHSPLWHAVVGLTDQYVHGRCSHDAYTAAVFELANRVADAPGADAPRTASLDDGGTVAAFARRRIAYAREFRFTLLRHWSLYDAMLHSPYVAVRLQTWREPGRQALDRLLAEVGLPLHECKQKFSHMSPACSRALKQRLDDKAAAYGLSDLSFWSFTKQHGYKLDVCAADVVHGVTALLESGGGSGDATGEGGEGGASAASDGPPSALEGSLSSGSLSSGRAAAAAAAAASGGGFWRAVEALSEAHWDTLRAGIAHAQRLQRATMRTGGLALLGNKVANVGPFRFVNLATAGAAAAAAAAGGGGDAELLRRPAALLRLALFIQDAVHASKPRRHLPLVLAAPCAAPAPDDAAAQAADPTGQGMVLVVGVTGRPQRGDARGNGFGTSFHVAAAAVRAPFVHDAFEAAVITVAASHLSAFLDQLQHEELDRAALAAQAAAQAV